MGRGGSRINAGRPSRHVKAEHCRRIDARRWQREDILSDGRAGGWAWTDAETGKQLSSIGYSTGPDAVVLSYSMSDKPVHQRLPIMSTPCHFGGLRKWFGCPHCARRVAVLFLRTSGFLCRHCNRVAYASQSDDVFSRSWRRQHKIEAQLGAHWQRPKGMHKTTHQRLFRKVMELEQWRDDALEAMAATFSRRFPGIEL